VESAATPTEPETVEVPAFNVEVLGLIADKLKQVEERDQPAVVIAEPIEPMAADGTAPPVPEAAETEPVIAPEQVPTPELPPEPVAPSVPPPKPAHVDEDSAMRAIEGGWSRRASRALPDAPEMTDVSAAVSAAQVAVEQVLARNGVNAAEPETRAQAAFGKPRGLPQPRLGGRDNLKQIKGLGPLDESTLNNLGIYHFDQILAWDQKEVLWLENHAFARGRIGREDWQEQARDLLRAADAARTGS
jgi:NADH-quinone oxidoreductase subunit E